MNSGSVTSGTLAAAVAPEHADIPAPASLPEPASADTPAAPGSDKLPSLELLGLPICCAPRKEILGWLLRRLDAAHATMVATPNAEIILHAHSQPEVQKLLLGADLLAPDGIGVVKAAQILHGLALERYPGIDIAEDLLAELALRGGRAYLLGAAPGVAEAAASRLTQRYVGLTMAGFRDGYFGAEQAQSIAEGIRAARADLLLVGMGCPRQEGFISQFRTQLGVPLMLGIGGALEVWSGGKRRAPGWVQRLHLEWFYRALQDPGRLGRTLRLSAFLRLVAAEKRRLERLKSASSSGQGGGGAR